MKPKALRWRKLRSTSVELGERAQQRLRRGIVAKGLAEVSKAVNIPGTEDKAAAELKGVFTQLVLAMSGGFGALPGCGVVSAKKVQQRCLLEVRGTVRLAVLINQQREGNAGLFAKLACVVIVTQPDGSQGRTLFSKFVLVLAQLRDVLAAEDSAVMAKEDDDRGLAGPERAQSDRLPLRIRQGDGGEAAA